MTTPISGAPGDDASGRSAPCDIIPRQTLLHHSAGRDRAVWPVTCEVRRRTLAGAWIETAHNLGITYDPSETGLGEWIERQTGISAMNWVDPATLAKVIEALKAWIAREGGVDWPPADAGPLEARRAVIEAQLRRGGQLAAQVDLGRMGASELDAVIAALGVEVRRRRAA